LLRATFKENGLKLYDFRAKKRRAFFTTYKINDKMVTVLSNAIIKTDEDLSDGLEEEYNKLEDALYYAYFYADYSYKSFRSFNNGLYRRINDKVLSEAKKRDPFTFSVDGNEALPIKLEGNAARVRSDVIGIYLLKKMTQKRKR